MQPAKPDETNGFKGRGPLTGAWGPNVNDFWWGPGFGEGTRGRLAWAKPFLHDVNKEFFVAKRLRTTSRPIPQTWARPSGMDFEAVRQRFPNCTQGQSTN
jgi:hypothetical protein